MKNFDIKYGIPSVANFEEKIPSAAVIPDIINKNDDIIFILNSETHGGRSFLFQGSNGNNISRPCDNPGFVARLEDNGRWYSTAYIALSDAKFKTNIEPLNNSLMRIKKLEGYRYNWKNDSKNKPKEYGVIAQQVESAGLNDLVHDDGNSKFVNYQSFIPLLIEGIKELSKQVDDLKLQLDQRS